MSKPFSLEFIESLISICMESADWTEQHGPEDGPCMQLTQAEHPEQSAGYVRLWVAPQDSPLDRMIHMRLLAGPVETQLLFAFGRADNTMPHFHAQAVQFPPAGCVYNADFLPRVDPVDDPDWFTTVFKEIRRPYKQAVGDRQNTCAQAPANPALAIYMSPWGIASSQTDQAELERVRPSLTRYAEHFRDLAQRDCWQAADPQALRERDQRHLEIFFSDELDPRAWNGVYKIVGEQSGRAIKKMMVTPCY